MRFRLSKSEYEAVIFDLDGVITKTAAVHAKAWKTMFDDYLRGRSDLSDDASRPFDIGDDYRKYVDGKPRYDGVRSFLRSRGIDLPYGDPDDPPEEETICGLGNRKNKLFVEIVARDGVEVYEKTIELIKNLRRIGIKVAVVSSSKNCAEVLKAAGIADLFDAKVDGRDSVKLGLKGKPDPDIFIRAAKDLGSSPGRCAVVEDAVAGVKAGRAGGFGCVVGVDRLGHPDALRDNGADFVVSNMGEIEVAEEGESDDLKE